MFVRSGSWTIRNEEEVCEEISLITQHREVQWHLANEEWFEAERERVDLCAAEVNAYLERKKDDPISSASSFTETWVRAHAPSDISQQGYVESEEDLLLGATAASFSSSLGTNIIEDTVVEPHCFVSAGQMNAPTVMPTMGHYLQIGAGPCDPYAYRSVQPLGYTEYCPVCLLENTHIPEILRNMEKLTS